jgi:hypothetical protein
MSAQIRADILGKNGKLRYDRRRLSYSKSKHSGKLAGILRNKCIAQKRASAFKERQQRRFIL